MRFSTYIVGLCLLLCASVTYASQGVLNVYIWGGEVPDSVIQQFEKETGIKVNYSTYDNNETLYAKLKATKRSGYDIIEPSSYYVDRMRREGMLQVIDRQKLSNYKNLDPSLLNQAYDPTGEYDIPLVWGTTGLFINTKFFSNTTLDQWNQLWNPMYKNKVLLLDDPREVFSMALISLGYSASDSDPQHIKEAYLKLKKLMPNVRLFSSDAVPSLVADDDATVGMIWNGDLHNAREDNPNLKFVYPTEGFGIWVDCFAIPKDAPHLDNAYRFLNFMMRGDVAVQSTLQNNYAVANLAARQLLPKALANDPVIFPSAETLKHGEFQMDVSDEALALYNYYWTLLKIEA